ncbi:hypothetical protein Ndes2526A_g05384 [Nannochloris sp. 'desiccata']
MEGIPDAPTVLKPGDQMFTVDLESAYHHVDMHPDFWQYLGFSWQGQYYVFCSLPFGLCIAPWVFTKLTRELVQRWRSLGRRLLHYLDDFLFAINQSDPLPFQEVQQSILSDLRAAGFSLSEEKLELAPATERKFLGFVFNTAANTIQLSESTLVPATLGCIAIGPSATTTARIPKLKLNYSSGRRTSPAINSTPLWHSTRIHSFEFYTDASDFGWGGHGNIQGTEFEAQGYFRPGEQGPLRSSTLRESWALERVLSSLLTIENIFKAKAAAGATSLRAYVDNQALTWIMRLGSRVPAINQVVKRMYEFCWQHNIKLAVDWIPRDLNTRADYLSKMYDGDDWKLNKRYFTQLDQRWGPHTVDVFASAINHQCPKFFSMYHCPGTSGVDAFAQDWGGENCWINPPFGLIGQVIRHLSLCKSQATLICPRWQGRPWWPLLLSPDGSHWAKPYVVEVLSLPTEPDLFLPGPKHGNQRAVGSPHWQVLAVRLDFSTHSHESPPIARLG